VREWDVTQIRRPKGYLGVDHQVLGSDILSVLRILKMPEQVLGAEETKRLTDVDARAWYPVGWLIELMDTLDKHVGPYGLKRMGRALYEMSHQDFSVAKSAREVLDALDDMYRHGNRGRHIGGWTVVRFERGYAEVDKTTPLHCMMEQGILSQALAGVGCPAVIGQSKCFREGADSCRFTIACPITDVRWTG
jgi:hypothetical protein